MPSINRTRASKNVDSSISAIRNLKREINQSEKKITKLLKLFKSGKKRWKVDNRNKKSDHKFMPIQGMAPDSKRHKALQSHISKMKARLKEL